jgi:photosystem II stability/assembly factor-like uncharacterized protein
MRRPSLLALVLLLCCYCTPDHGGAQSLQWQSINGPSWSYYVCGVATHPSGRVFALTNWAGLFSTADGGRSWLYHSIDSSASGYYAIACDSAGTILVSSESRVYWSHDCGMTWNLTGFPLYSLGLSDIGVGKRLWIVGTSDQTFRSTDGGVSWVRIPLGKSSLSGRPPAFASGPGGEFYLGGDTLYETTDAGETWKRIRTPFQGSILALAVDQSGVLYCGFRYNGVYKSPDHGDSWVRADSGMEGKSIFRLLHTSDGVMFAACLEGLKQSTDGGRFWSPAGQGASVEGFTRLAADSSGGIFMNGGYGIQYFPRNSATWKTISYDLTRAKAGALVFDPGGRLLCGSSKHIFWTDDAGRSWTCDDGEWAARSPLSLCSGGDLLFAGSDDGGILRSSDRGESWELVYRDSLVPYVVSVAADPSGQVGAALLGKGVVTSSDQGVHWSSFVNGLGDSSVHCVAFDSARSILAGTENGLYVAKVPGTRWYLSGLEGFSVLSLLVDPEGHYFAGTDKRGVYTSADGGSSWTYAGLLGLTVFTISRNQHGDLFAGTLNGGVASSTDGGIHWTSGNSGLWTLDVPAIAIGPDGYAYAGTFVNGIYRSMTTTWTSAFIGQTRSGPSCFLLEQNYPNPFNPVTTIRYTVGVASGKGQVAGEPGTRVEGRGSGNTRLVVYDLLGREVATLVDERKAPGSYEVSFNASGLSSGVYLCRMTAGWFTQTRKLVLVR